MLSFRQKILISYLVIFLIFLAFMFPFASRTVKKIVSNALEERANELIASLRTAPNTEALLQRLRQQKYLLFFRVSIIDHDGRVLYDTHAKRLFGPQFTPGYKTTHPEVEDALTTGTGYAEGYSHLLNQKLAYVAKAFDFHGNTFVIRTAFPYKQIEELQSNFEIGFLSIGSAALLLFMVLSWIVILHLSRPIQQIINAVKPYQEGKQDHIQHIRLASTNPKDDFSRLATTLNSLSERVQSQIKTLVHERNEKAAILESLGEGVVAVDENMIVKYANETSLQMLRVSEDEFLEKDFSVARQHACYDLLVKCQEKNEVLTTTLQPEVKAKVYFDIVAAPKGFKQGAILVLQDKTSHYKILEMRKDFIANASHELKTPITIIQGFAETLHDNPNLPEEQCVGITEKIVRNCGRMHKIVKDLLTLADIENLPSSRLQKCNLYHLVENCQNVLLSVFPDATVDIKVDGKGEIQTVGDPHLLELAITNLLNNAAKYSNGPAVIHVNLEQVEKAVRITVTDEGIGIPPEDLEFIFHRFYTVDKAHSRRLGGSGLGLAIVETIIQKHSGEISVDSVLGEGTTFTIILPFKPDLLKSNQQIL